ncbi:hypothetical protein BD779DRAFT_1676332 [Infundibulicybe gibba]|nr:hypothetical protein BD779DRAFT_1676332 [Infundibulicybe gibba]
MVNLPAEIIQTIFLELCSPETIFPLRQNEPRLLVTHVSSQWRTIALSMPTLWANINIRARGSYSASLLGSVRAWISRSAQSALSIKLFGFNSNRISSMFVDLVFPVIHRCSFLDSHFNATTLNHLLTLPSNSLHTLQSIRLFLDDDMADPTPFATAFQSCPKLHTFLFSTFMHPNSYLEIANFNVPWHQLTILCLSSLTIPAYDCLDVVRRCTSLQECHISISPVHGLALQRIIDLSHHPVILPSLRALRVSFSDSEHDNFMFLHALRLPCLRSFRPELPTWTPMGPAPWPFSTLAPPAFWPLSVLRSVLSDTIKELNLSLFPISTYLSETLAQVPNLEILWLNDDYDSYQEIMRALGEGIIAPRLTTLKLRYVDSSDLLFDTLKARMAAACANSDITAFVTVIEKCSDLTDKAHLLTLTETGIQVEFLS